ncbi:hypothetical protein [Micromonospora chersina]|uniref:hypothetical protein n=1 Tax=Micromonospora chersina TaxID=47854 RepID=UPI003D8B70F0
MLTHRTSRRWAVPLALFSLLVSNAGLGAGPAHAARAGVDVAAFTERPGVSTTTVTGKVGDVVKVTAGIYNTGPGKVQWMGFTHQAQTWTFTLPPGTETVEGPRGEKPLWGWAGSGFADSCDNTSGGELEYFGVGPYDCMSAGSLEPEATSQMTFNLRINKVIPNATGSVTFDRHLKSPFTGAESLADSNEDNDQASFVINPDPHVAAVVAGVPITRTALGAATALLLLTVGTGLFLYVRGRPRRAGGSSVPIA